jgi:hypothetical protein
MATGEIFASTQHKARYRVAAVHESQIVIERLDANAPENLTEGEVRRAVEKLNVAGGRSRRRSLNYTVAKEVALVHFHPGLRWSPDQDNIEIITAPPAIYPDEVPEPARYAEGATRTVRINVYERNPAARAACIKHYGCRCQVCGMTFIEHYGEIGEGFIHVHHLKPLAGIGTEYVVDPVADLRPVCPNCHAMLHVTEPPLSIEGLRGRIQKCGDEPQPTEH